jgi:hypothetical protein
VRELLLLSVERLRERAQLAERVAQCAEGGVQRVPRVWVGVDESTGAGERAQVGAGGPVDSLQRLVELDRGQDRAGGQGRPGRQRPGARMAGIELDVGLAEQGAMPDADGRVAVDARLCRVDREGDLGGVAGQPAVGHLSDAHAADEHDRLLDEGLAVGELGADAIGRAAGEGTGTAERLVEDREDDRGEDQAGGDGEHAGLGNPAVHRLSSFGGLA